MRNTVLLLSLALSATVSTTGCSSDDENPRSGVADGSWTAPAEYAEGQVHSELTQPIVTRLRAIHAISKGRNERFIKVGDATTISNGFLECLAENELDGNLEETRRFFDSSTWTRDTSAAKVGWRTPELFKGSPAPIESEIAAMDPAFAVVALGTNDVYESAPADYEASLRSMVSSLTLRGIVPILSTIPPVRDASRNEVIPTLNRIVRRVAAETSTPLVDYHLAVRELPGLGLSNDGSRPSVDRDGACDFSSSALRSGQNQRNYVTLVALDRVRRAVLNDGWTSEGAFGATTTVEAWQEANIRSCPASSCSIIGQVSTGERYPASCWTRGDLVRDDGYSNDRWVRIQRSSQTGYVSAVYLRGDETGGVDQSCPR